MLQFGNFGGAIFNDWCMESRTGGSNTLVRTSDVRGGLALPSIQSTTGGIEERVEWPLDFS